MKLTEHFTLEEFLASNTATRKKIDNTPSQTIISHLKELATQIIEPLRLAWGSGIIVSSGYRCEKLNKAVGGSSTSAHLTGWAADLVPSNGDIEGFKKFVINWLKTKKIKFDQYINETTKSAQWVHIALYNKSKQQRKQYLRYKGGVYTKI